MSEQQRLNLLYVVAESRRVADEATAEGNDAADYLTGCADQAELIADVLLPDGQHVRTMP